MSKSVRISKSSSLNVANSDFVIKPISENVLVNKDISKIITFYVFHTPISSVSSLSVKLDDYGWNNPWEKPENLNKKLAKAFDNLDFQNFDANVENMKDELTQADMYEDFPKSIDCEKICINNCESNHYLSLFRHIRNCFCHGRFAIYNLGNKKTVVFVFEDINTNNKVNGRMIIRKNTLLRWIEIIKNGPSIK